MANQPYLVVRLVPEAPIDGATFTTYLEGLQLQVFDAYTGAALSDVAFCSPMSIFSWPQSSGQIDLSVVSSPVNSPANFNSATNNYGTTLQFDSTDGISVGAFVFSADQTTIPPFGQVSEVEEQAVTLQNGLPNYVPSGTVVTFVSVWPNNNPFGSGAPSFALTTTAPAKTVDGQPASSKDLPAILTFANTAGTAGVTVGMAVGPQAGSIAGGTTVVEVTPTTVTISPPLLSLATPSSVTFSLSEPYASLTLTLKSSSSTTTTLTFASAASVAVGMALSPQSGIPPGSIVTQVTSTAVTIKPALPAPLAGNPSVTFTFPLSTGIVQHFTDTVQLGIITAAVPDSVATAIVPLNLSTPGAPSAFPPMPDYLNVKLTAARAAGANSAGDVIPITTTFYNVRWQEDELPAANVYQLIPDNETSLYITLPPQPGTTPIPLAIPSDGSPPRFDALFDAVQTALTNDPILGAVTSSNITSLIAQLSASSANCTRIAYDIVWSYQNPLPIPPDPLESLYGNPPNPGNSSTQSSSGNNNLEQDRQKFEGTLNSFYSTRNATAERLAKFVAAVSAAVSCELSSVNAQAALLEFPVDSSQPFAKAVESEILLQGIGGTAANAINFGVPAAFFYALSAKMDKSTTAVQRYQMAIGDAIDRLLQEFEAAEDAGVIEDSEAFSDPDPALGGVITSFQAARRLVALGVSAASGSPVVTLNPAAAANTPEGALTALVNAWRTATDPTGSGPPANPPPTYAQKDFAVWQQLAAATPSGPAGYVALDLYTLTQGYSIPSVGPLADQILLATSTFNWPATGATVATLRQATSAQWTAFFNTHQTWLPPFTQPVVPAASQPAITPKAGYTAARIRAFIRAVQKFFTVSSIATSAQPWTPGAPPTFNLPANDPIGGSGLNFNTVLTPAHHRRSAGERVGFRSVLRY